MICQIPGTLSKLKAYMILPKPTGEINNFNNLVGHFQIEKAFNLLLK